MAPDAELCEALGFKVLQLVARQARTIMNIRFFNIFSTFEDIGTGKGKQKCQKICQFPHPSSLPLATHKLVAGVPALLVWKECASPPRTLLVNCVFIPGSIL